MNKIVILYTQFLDFDGEKDKIGGIETYIKNLAEVGNQIGYDIIIIQFANKNFERIYLDKIKVIGVYDKKKKNSNILLQKSYEFADIDKDVLIFASSYMNKRNKYKKSFAIQHGIYWDLNIVKKKEFNKIFSTFLKSFQIVLEIRRNKCVNKVICVDYNYINWYRACTKLTSEHLLCIPNFTNINYSYTEKNNEIVKIIFARRFENIRGVKNVSKVINKLIDNNIKFEFTFAGSGTCEQELKKMFANYENVKFITYKPEDSAKIHLEYDIAIVPSIGSEGTSLSLLEAMSASCCVIATNVGGLTNIIIDNYNGKICDITFESLYDCLKELIVNDNKRKRLAQKGYESVVNGFNIDNWRDKWRRIFDE